MKKKFKLMSSIASLALALALMSFGVLAAASHTFHVTNSVSFRVGENITFSIAGVKSVGPSGALVASTYYNNGNPEAEPVVAANTSAEGLPYEVLSNNNNGTLANWTDATAVTLDQTNDTVSWTFTIINLGSNAIQASISSTPTGFVNGTNCTITNNGMTSIAQGATGTLTYTITMTDFSTTVNAETIDLAVTIERV